MLIVQSLLGIGSILLAEIIRDLYHVAGHYWKPLQSWHNLHHKVYRPDLSVVSPEMYRQAQWYNDVPEATVMVVLMAIVAWWVGQPGAWVGCLYAGSFLVTAAARSRGWLMGTDLTHKPGELLTPPSQWTVNRTYHWRHHFDEGNAYFCSTFTLIDQLLGACVSLKGKRVAITGASGSMGRALLQELTRRGARVIALTSSAEATFDPAVQVWQWQVGAEAELKERLNKVDILIINHGINVGSERSPAAIQSSLEINTLSAWRWMELFLSTVETSRDRAVKEVWINTSEAEVNPAFGPLYELSKRAIGDLITLRRLDAPCVIRKLILGPFKSNLNPIGILSPQWVAWAIVALAQRDVRDIIVTINPLTYLLFPVKEFSRSLYFRLFSRSRSDLTPPQPSAAIATAPSQLN